MCSIGEEDFGDEGGAHAMPRDMDVSTPIDVDAEVLCKKCNEQVAVVKISFREPECQGCFLANVRHKFRATLGSSKILPKNAEVLILFDGSDASIALTDMLYYAQTQNSFKRLHCSTKLLYIDEDFGHNLDLKQIETFLQKYNFESYIVSIGGSGVPINFRDILSYIQDSERKSEEDKFHAEFESIRTLTSQQDYLERRRKEIAKRVADFFGIHFIFLSDISLDMAVTLLTDVSLGRGGAMAYDVSLCDSRYENISFVRPLKDLTVQEINNYLKFCNLENTGLPEIFAYGANSGANASIKNLTRDFIGNLQNGFSSTVSTVFRVGDKIAANQIEPDANLETKLQQLNITSTKCMFCHSHLDFFDSSTLLAIEFSKLTSENTSAENLQDLDSLEKRAWDSLYGETNNEEILKNLCHGCRNLYRDCGNYLFM